MNPLYQIDPWSDFLAEREIVFLQKKNADLDYYWSQGQIIVAAGIATSQSWFLPVLSAYLDYKITSVWVSAKNQTLAGAFNFLPSSFSLFDTVGSGPVCDSMPASGWNGFAGAQNVNMHFAAGASQLMCGINVLKNMSLQITVNSFGAIAVGDVIQQNLHFTFKLL